MSKETIKIIKELQRDYGISDVDLASKMGVSFSSARYWRLGLRNPNRFAKKKLKQILKANQRVGIKNA